jgi:hypothetical protein
MSTLMIVFVESNILGGRSRGRRLLQVLFSDMVEEKRGMLEELLAYLDEPEVPLPKITQVTHDAHEGVVSSVR